MKPSEAEASRLTPAATPDSLTTTPRLTTRRTAIIALFGAFLADVRIAHAEGGSLRVALDQWKGITFEHSGRTVTITAAEIFAALKEKK
jgi:hypothetical protein